MVEPFRWLGCDVDFYRVRADLSVDPEDLARRIAPRTRLAVLVDYFGFEHANEEAISLCRDAGIALVKDCAHRLMLPALPDEFVAGVASLPKFLPVREGGAIVAADPALLEGPSVDASPGRALRTLISVYRAQRAATRQSQLNGAWGEPVTALDPDLLPSPDSLDRQPEPEEYRYFNAARFESGVSVVTARIVRSQDLEQVARRRRECYRAVADAVAENPSLQPLFDGLPDAITPYVFPVVLPDAVRQFELLHHNGIGILRWEDMAVSDCPISTAYRLSLVQIPCHQELTDLQLERLVEVVGTIR